MVRKCFEPIKFFTVAIFLSSSPRRVLQFLQIFNAWCVNDQSFENCYFVGGRLLLAFDMSASNAGDTKLT